MKALMGATGIDPHDPRPQTVAVLPGGLPIGVVGDLLQAVDEVLASHGYDAMLGTDPRGYVIRASRRNPQSDVARRSLADVDVRGGKSK